MEHFKKCPECGRYMISEIVSTGHIKWVCICGNVVHTGFTDISYDNKTTYTGGGANDRTVIKQESCNACKVDRQIGNPNRWQCECDRCDKPNDWKNECVKKLAEYETAEEEGRLVVLPCKVGDTVWMVHQRLTSTVNNVISKMTVTELRGNRLNPIWFVIDGEYGRTSFHPSEIGKTVFLTREEAEKALKEMEGK